jgi:hypothetical protein
MSRPLSFNTLAASVAACPAESRGMAVFTASSAEAFVSGWAATTAATSKLSKADLGILERAGKLTDRSAEQLKEPF